MDRLRKQPLVSIVIPVVPNDKHIQECVDHVKRSTWQNYELLIINESKERSYQRNVGINAAKGEYILWLDSDMMISPMLIEDCVDKIEAEGKVLKGTPVGVYIPERIVTKGWFGKLRDWERQFYTGTLVDVMRFIRKKDCPLFDETLHGVEDSDWERRCPPGQKAVSDYSFNHHDKVGLLKYLKKKAYYAKCLCQYKLKNPNDRLLTLKYRCWDVFTENGKWKTFFARPHLALLVFCLIFARGVIAMVQEARYK